jgi:hypothetical protein
MMPKDGGSEMLRVHAMSEARQVVKARLRRENEKPSPWPQAAISRLALQYLNEGHWREFIELARQKSMTTPVLRA